MGNSIELPQNTPLHLAAKHRNTLMVCLLLKAEADPLLRNAAGERAVDIAVANEDADIVTMLRLASMRGGVEVGPAGRAVPLRSGQSPPARLWLR